MQLKRLVFLVFLGIFLPVIIVWGSSVVTGTVVSLNPDGGRFVILQSETMRAVNVLTNGRIPEFIQPGAKVRIWGGFVETRPPTFRAQKIIFDNTGRKKNDPTGVRSRLNKGRIRLPGQ